MKRLGTLVGAGVLVLLTGACASSADNPGSADQPAPTTERPASPSSAEPDKQPARTPPSGGAEVAAGQIDASALPDGFPVLVWTLDDGRTIGVVAQEGGCGKASLEVPAQGAAEVVINMVETVPGEPRPCTMDLRYPKLTTRLDQPLGERTVVLKTEQRED